MSFFKSLVLFIEMSEGNSNGDSDVEVTENEVLNRSVTRSRSRQLVGREDSEDEGDNESQEEEEETPPLFLRKPSLWFLTKYPTRINDSSTI